VNYLKHRSEAPAIINCFILTVSDTRTSETDTSGRTMRDVLTKNGHSIVGYKLVPDDPVQIEDVIRKQIANSEVQVILTTGGTGITSRDSTFEIVDKLLTKKLDGFGELFRVLSFQEIGAAAMLSRATAGTANHTAIFVLPGSKPAVQLALTKLIVPELGHVVQQMNR